MVRVAHERARQLEAGIGLAFGKVRSAGSGSSGGGGGGGGRRVAVGGVDSEGEGDLLGTSPATATASTAVVDDYDRDLGDCFSFGVGLGEIDPESVSQGAILRPVTTNDFKEAIKRLKASVDEGGRELQKVVEWNEKYGEVKRKGAKAKGSTHMSLYI